MKNTFAARAKKINERYKYADRVASDREARDSELLALFQEQEAYKQNMQTQANEFALGGSDDPFTENQFSPWKQENIIPDFESYTNRPPQERLSIPREWEVDGEESLVPGFLDDYKIATQNFEAFDPAPTTFISRFMHNMGSDDYLRIGAGVAGAAGNAINMANVDDPKLITPDRVNPTFTFRGTDLSAYDSALANQAASTRYSTLQSGVDFDTASAGVAKTNQQFASAAGQVQVEKQKLDNTEGARGDEIMNKGAYFNASNMNQAKIDLAAREDIADQKKRDYFAALSRNVQGMLIDEGDKAYAESLEPFMEQLAALTGYQKGKTD